VFEYKNIWFIFSGFAQLCTTVKKKNFYFVHDYSKTIYPNLSLDIMAYKRHAYKRICIKWFLFTLIEEAAAKAKWGMYVGIGVLIFILAIAVFCIVRRCKARQAYRHTNTTTTTTNQPYTNTPLVNQNEYYKPPPAIVYPAATGGGYQTQPYEFSGM